MRPIERSLFVLVMALAGFGCGDDGDGGAGGESSSGSTSGSSKSTSGPTTGSTSGSGMTTASTSGTASSSGDASSSSTGVMCPDIQCTNMCPAGFWPELDTCPSCACEETLSFIRNLNGHPQQHISTSAQASPFIGGLDRWELGLTWTYDDPQASDDREVITVTVRLPVMDLMTEPGEANEMRVYEMGGGDLEIQGGKWSLFGFGLIEEDIAPTGGFISIRRNGMLFEGFASLDFDSTESPSTYHIGGAFGAPIPPI